MRALRPWLVNAFSGVVNALFRGLLYTFARLEIVGRERLPEGASLMIANHLHLIDPPLVMAICQRPVHPMAKRELFEIPLVGWVFWAMRAHIRRVGAAAVAVLSGAKLVAVAITGTQGVTVPGVFFRWLRRDRPRIRVEFGEPFDLPREFSDASKAMEASDFIMRQLAELLPESYRGAYGAGSEGTVVVRRSEVRPGAPRRP
jgi:1-acyl-sn-glycerol-3-phosphate acyltransferase